MIQDVVEEAKSPQSQLTLSFVYPDRDGFNQIVQFAQIHSTREGPNDLKTLSSLDFVIGDIIDIYISNGKTR